MMNRRTFNNNLLALIPAGMLPMGLAAGTSAELAPEVLLTSFREQLLAADYGHLPLENLVANLAVPASPFTYHADGVSFQNREGGRVRLKKHKDRVYAVIYPAG